MTAIPITRRAQLKTLPQAPLGFGKYFSDHMYLLNFTRAQGWHNPRIVPYEALSLEPAACVLHYAQASFEGLKAFKHKNGDVAIFRPQFNAARMRKGAERLCMPGVPEDLFIEGVAELVRLDSRWVPAERGSSLYIRPTLIGTEGFLGVRPADEYYFLSFFPPSVPTMRPAHIRLKFGSRLRKFAPPLAD